MRPQFTARELEIVNLICDAYNRDSIAQLLNITPNTVSTHFRHIFYKLRVSSVLEVAVTTLNARHAEKIKELSSTAMRAE